MLRPLALAAALATGALPALALPTGAQLRFGQAQVQQTGAQQLDIRQTSPRAGLDWTGFSIAAGERVRIHQPGRDAVLLNRVTGSDPSLIFGSLQSNGTVWLVNPRGIVFGRDSRVDVGGLVASTLGLRPDSLAAGRVQLGGDGGDGAVPGAIQADGRISAPGGSVVLVAPSLAQGGQIDARRIGLAAATSVQVDVEGDGLVFFNARNDGGLATRLQQLGTLRADGGTAELRAAGRAGFADTVLNLEGVVQARSIGMRGGRIVIDGGDSGTTRVAGVVDARGDGADDRGGLVQVSGRHLDLPAGSLVDAGGGAGGGTVQLSAATGTGGGDLQLRGSVLARGDGLGATGGQVDLTGERVGLFGQALVDAGGRAGGGQVRIGGDYQGGGTLARSSMTVLGADTVVRADAVDSGRGGRVIVWSDGDTLFDGRISAAGAGIGQGGLVETSGKVGLGIGLGRVGFGAGGGGTWLLDPATLTVATGGAGAYNAAETFSITPATLSISPTALRTAADGVPASEGNPGVDPVPQIILRATDQVRIANDLNLGANPTRLTIETNAAGGRITIDASVTTSGVIEMRNTNTAAGADASIPRITLASGSTITASNAGTANNASILLDAGGGHVVLDGALSTSNTGAQAIRILNAGNLQVAGLTTGAGGTATLDLSGTGTQAAATLLNAGTLVKSGAGNLTLSRANTLGAASITGGALVLSGAAARVGAAATIAVGSNRLVLDDVTVASNVAIGNNGTISNANGAGRLNGTLTVNGSATLSSASPGTGLTLAGAIGNDGANAGRLVIGGGTVTLTGDNGFTGGTTVNGGGRLVIGSDDALGDGGLALANGTLAPSQALVTAKNLVLGTGPATAGGTVDTTNGAVTLNGLVSGSSLTKAGTGLLTLAPVAPAANTHADTVIEGGTLVAGTAGALGSSNLSLRNNATLQATVNTDITGTTQIGAGGGQFSVDTNRVLNLNGALSGAGTLTKTGAGQLVLAPANPATNTVAAMNIAQGTLTAGSARALGSGTLQIGAGATLQATGTIDTSQTVSLDAGAGTVDVTGAGTVLTLRSAVSGAGSLTKAGAGRLVLAANNGYAGGTLVQGGALAIDAAAAAADAGDGAINLGAFTLDLRNGAVLASNVTTSGGTVTNGAGSGRLNGTLTLAADSSVSSTATGPGAGLTLAGAIGQTGGTRGLDLTAGTVTLANANTFAGTMQVTSGTLVIDGNDVNTANAGLGTINLGANRLDINRGASVDSPLTLAAGAVIGNTAGTGTLAPDRVDNTRPLALANGQTLQLDSTGAGNRLVIARPVTDLNAGGNAVLRITGSGTVELQGSVGHGGGTRVTDSGTLAVAAAARLGGGDLTLDNGTLRLLAGFTTTAKDVVLQAGGGRILVDNTVAASLTGEVSGAQGTLTKTGDGTLTLAAGNSHGGGTAVNGGTLVIGDITALGSGNLGLDGGNLQVTAGLATSKTVALGSNGGTVTVVNAGDVVRLNGVVSNATAGQGQPPVSGALAKAGGGTLVLAADNAYSGGTTVLGGTLAIDGSTTSLADAGSGVVNLGSFTLDLRSGAALPNAVRAGGATPAVITNSIGAGRLAGALTLTGNATLSSTGTGLTLAGPIGQEGGDRALTLTTGTVTLTRANTYAGDTLVNGGTLVLDGPGASAGTGTIVLNDRILDLRNGAVAGDVQVNGGTITNQAGAGRLEGTLTLQGDATLSSTDSGSGLVLAGTVGPNAGANRLVIEAGRVTLAGANTHAGNTRVNGGTLVIDGPTASAGTGTIELRGNRLEIANNASVSNAVTVDDGATISASGALGGTLAVGAAGVADTLALQQQDSTLHLASTGGGDLRVQRALLNHPSGRQGLQIDSGSVTLSSAGNTFDGGIGVTAGTLRLADDRAAGASSGTIALGGNTLDIVDGAAVDNPLTATNGATITSSQGSGGTLLAGSAALTLAANTRLNLSATVAGGLLVDRAIEAAAGATGTTSLAIGGGNGGAVTLSQTNTHGNGTTVNAGGRLVIASDAPLGSGSLTLAGGTLAPSTGLSTATNIVLDGGGGTVDTSAGDVTLSGVLSGTALVKAGANTLVLANDNGFNGGTTVQAGTLAIDAGSVAAADAGSGLITLGNRTLELRNGADLVGGLALAGGTLSAIGGSSQLGGDLTLASVNPESTLSAGNGATLTINGAIGQSLAGSTLTTNGTVVFRGAGSYSGTTNVATGSLTLDGNGASTGSGPVELGANRLVLNNGAAVAGEVRVAGGTIANTAGSGEIGPTGALRITGSARLQATSAAANAGLTVRGAVSETVADSGLVIEGGGRVTLAAAGGQTGDTQVTAGTLAISGSGSSAGSGAILLGNHRLEIDSGAVVIAPVTVASGATIANRLGTGTLATGALPAAQALTLGDGVGITLSAGGTALVIDRIITDTHDNGRLTVTGSAQVVLQRANGHDGGTTVNGGGTLAINALAALGGGGLLLDDGRLQAGAALTAGAGLALSLGAGGGTLDTGAFDVDLGGVVSGNGQLRKDGAGTLTLRADNGHGGGTRIDAGVLAIRGNGADAGSGLVDVRGAVLDLSDGARLANAVALGAGGSIRTTSGTGTLTAAGSLRLDGDATARVSTAAPGTGLVLEGAVSGDAAHRLTLDGGGTLTLANANPYAGGTTVASGTLRVDAQAVTGANAGSGPIDLGSGTLDLRHGAVLSNAVTVAGGQVLNSAGSGTLAGPLTLAGNAGVASTGSGLLLSGLVTGPGSLAAQGGSLTLSHAGNDFAGGVGIGAGTLAVTGGDALPDAVTVTLSGTGRLQLAVDERIGALAGSGGTSVDLGSRTLTIGGSGDGAMAGTIGGGAGSVIKTGSGMLTLSGSNGYTGTTTVSGGVLQLAGAGERLADAGRLVVSGTGTVDLGTLTETVAGVRLDGGEIRNGTLVSASNFDLRAGRVLAVLDGTMPAAGAAPVGLDKSGNGTVVLGGASRTLGDTTVTGGTLELAGGERLADASRLVLRDGTVDLGNATETVAGLQQAGGLLRNGLLVSRDTVELQAGEISARLGGLTDAVGLTKSGGGTALLSGANLYRGPTTVRDGTLQLAGSTGVLHDDSALRVDGGTLDIGSHDETVRSAGLLAGRITGTSGLLTSTEAFDLQAGRIDAVLAGSAGATKTGGGDVTLSRTNRYRGETRIDDGRLVLTDAQRLDAAGTLRVGSGGTLVMAGDQALAGVVLQGGATGSGTLSAPSLLLGGGRLDVPVAVTTLGSAGSSTINATAEAGTLTVSDGTLTLGGAQLLGGGTQLVVEPDARLLLGGPNAVRSLLLRGTLAGTGPLTAGSYQLDGGTAQVPLGTGVLRSSGNSRLEQPADAGTVQVLAGTLTTTALALFNAEPAVDVAANAQWLPGGSQRIGSLAGAGGVVLDGVTLRTGSRGDSRFDGTLTGSGSLVKQGDGVFTLAGSSQATGETVVEAGRLALTGAERLADGATVRVLRDATLALDAAERIGALDLAGTLAGGGTLRADSYLLQGGRTEAGLGRGALTATTASTLAGAAAVDSIVLTGGSLTLTDGASLGATPAVTLAADTTLHLGAASTLGSLAGAGQVNLGRFTLTTGALGDSRFDGTISGTGGLVKQGDGRFTLGGVHGFTGDTVVAAGTLALDGVDRLHPATAVRVGPAATLALAGDAHVASLQLQGTLAGGGTLTAASVLIDGGQAHADLSAGMLRSRGDSRLAGSARVTTLQVEIGQLALASADRLSAGADVQVDKDARLTLAGSEHVGGLTLAGTLDGSGTLSAPLLRLQDGTAVADLSGDRLVSTGSSRLVGQALVGQLQVDDGRLELASAGRLLGTPAATLAAGSTLALGGDDRLGSLAGAGTVALGAHTLRTGAGGSSRFDGAIDGDGGLIKQGADSSFTLTGRSGYRGSTWVAEGTLTVGDGQAGGALAATSDLRIDGVLRFDRADALRLAQPVTGGGTLEQAGRGTLTLAGANKSHSGTTLVSQGTLQTEGDGALSTTSAVRVLADGRLVLAGAETVQSVQADGGVTLATRLTAAGTLAFDGPVTVAGGGPLQLQAASIVAQDAGNRWGSRLSVDTTGELRLDAGTDGAGPRALTLGEVEVGDGGHIRAARLLLDGRTTLRGGTLTLDLVGGEVALPPEAELLGKRTPSTRQIAFSDDLLRQSEPTAARPVALQVDAGAQLAVQAPAGGSVALRNLDNRVDGGLSVVLGRPDAAWVPNDKPVVAPEFSLQHRVRLGGTQLVIGGVGIQADVVSIEADGLSTTGSAVIAAKLPYDNLAGSVSQAPALTLLLRDPGAFIDAGGPTSSSFGSALAPLRVDVGSIGFGGRTGLLIDGGFLSVQPAVRAGGIGRTAVFLQGPLAAAGYSFFYEGARRQGAVPVFYNGISAETPQVSDSISSTLAVSEGARKERFDEAVRTENVALRLRAGVIAEVGPGRPATVSTTTLEGLRPPSCSPAPGTLACP
ncbi:MAG: autotransporter-associated beta strand repeat-containing protein [Pseudomonadota bacterium]